MTLQSTFQVLCETSWVRKGKMRLGAHLVLNKSFSLFCCSFVSHLAFRLRGTRYERQPMFLINEIILFSANWPLCVWSPNEQLWNNKKIKNHSYISQVWFFWLSSFSQQRPLYYVRAATQGTRKGRIEKKDFPIGAHVEVNWNTELGAHN